jgi:hypothetical protein
MPLARKRWPQALSATEPYQLFSWDITYLPTSIKRSYFYLYLHALDMRSLLEHKRKGDDGTGDKRLASERNSATASTCCFSAAQPGGSSRIN